MSAYNRFRHACHVFLTAEARRWMCYLTGRDGCYAINSFWSLLRPEFQDMWHHYFFSDRELLRDSLAECNAPFGLCIDGDLILR